MAGNQFTDLPPGATVVAPNYTDLPPGAVIQPGVNLRRPAAGAPLGHRDWWDQNAARLGLPANPTSLNEIEQARQQFDPEGFAAFNQSGQGQIFNEAPRIFSDPNNERGPAGAGETEWSPEAQGQNIPITGFAQFGRAVRHGATLGYDDDIAKALGGNGELINQLLAGYRTADPMAAALGELLGGAATSAIPGAWAARGATTASRAFRGLGVGTGVGAAQGAGEAEGTVGDRAQAALIPALAGGATGALIPLLMRGTRMTSAGNETEAWKLLARNNAATPADINAAERLMQQSQGTVPLTWAEALSQVTNGRVNLAPIQRFAEQSTGGSPIMSAAMADRPGQVQAAMGSRAPRIGPAIDPAVLGGTIQRAAEGEIERVTDAINAATRGLYRSSASTPADPAAFAALQADPLFAAGLRELRDSDTLARMIDGYPDNSVQVLDAVAQYLERSRATRSAVAGDNLSATIQRGVADDARAAATTASPQYGQARQQQAIMRRTDLEPLQQGPIGAMSETADVSRQLNTLFARSPLESSDKAIGDAVSRLAAADPDAASALVRQHIVSTFNESTRALQGGGNQFGGANFVADLLGNSQQARNLQAAVTALPNGQNTWAGLRQFADVLEATGRRAPANSATTFNQMLREQASRGGGVGNLITLLASPGKAASAVRSWYADMRLGRNGAALAEILTNPDNAALWRRMAMGGSQTDLEEIALALINSAGGGAAPLAYSGSSSNDALIQQLMGGANR